MSDERPASKPLEIKVAELIGHQDWIRAIDHKAAQKIRVNSDGDIEMDHANADGILCELLIDLGCTETVKEFEKLPKWYA